VPALLVGAGLIGTGLLGPEQETAMADYSVTLAKSATLGAATIDTITLTAPSSSHRFESAVIVTNRHATGVIWATLDGTDPAADGDDVYPVGPGESFSLPRPDYGDAVLKLISPDACPYWVRVV
jgi:hypothetical protein